MEAPPRAKPLPLAPGRGGECFRSPQGHPEPVLEAIQQPRLTAALLTVAAAVAPLPPPPCMQMTHSWVSRSNALATYAGTVLAVVCLAVTATGGVPADTHAAAAAAMYQWSVRLPVQCLDLKPVLPSLPLFIPLQTTSTGPHPWCTVILWERRACKRSSGTIGCGLPGGAALPRGGAACPVGAQPAAALLRPQLLAQFRGRH